MEAKEVITYRKAKLLKKLGFDESCSNMYDNNGNFSEIIDNAKGYIACPSLEQTKEWLINKFNISIDININTDGRYTWEYKFNKLNLTYESYFKSFYSENSALLNCLNEIIEDIYSSMYRCKTLIKKESPEDKKIREEKEQEEKEQKMYETKLQTEKEREQRSKEVEEMVYGRKYFLTTRHRYDDAWRRFIYGLIY